MMDLIRILSWRTLPMTDGTKLTGSFLNLYPSSGVM